MPITFNTNLPALTSQRYIGNASNAASSSLAKLSSGSRIPQAKDDAAGLAIGSKLRAEVAGLTTASNNASQAVSLLQIADGALSTVGDILVRMKSLATQSSSGQLGDAERSLLNQEFVNLRSEIDRISSTSNFNGTTLLAGSTTVISDLNGMAAYTGTGANQNDTSATNLIGAGFESFSFKDSYGDGMVRVEYNGTTRNMTVKDLIGNRTQTIQLSSSTIAAGTTEEYNFGDVGVKIKLNNQFSKATSISGTNSANVSIANTGITLTSSTVSLGYTGVTANTATITAMSLTGTGTNRIFADQLAGAAVTYTGAQTAVLASNITVGGSTFFNITGTTSFAVAGNHDYNYSDGNGNTFTLRVNTTGAATGGAGGGTTTFDSTYGGAIENSGTNQPVVTTIVNSGTAGNEFNWGSLTNARLTFDATNEAAVTAQITTGGVTFSTANAGGATGNFSSTGTKSLTLADANGNAFTVQLNVTRAFGATDSTGQIVLGEFGQYVASQSSTSANTTFSFKVGTGTTSNDSVTFSLSSATTTALGINASTIDTAANANTAINALNAAVTTVSSRRADVGANQSRLEFASANISVAIENTTAATSAIMDVDVSQEITRFTSKNVLLQAGISLLAQANQQPSLLLSLLQ